MMAIKIEYKSSTSNLTPYTTRLILYGSYAIIVIFKIFVLTLYIFFKNETRIIITKTQLKFILVR